MKLKSHLISVRYVSSHFLARVKAFLAPTPGSIGLSIQVFYPSHGFGVRNFSEINLSGRQVRVL